MKILVTGGAGFIGSNIVDAYIELGHEVIALDNLSSGNKDQVNPNARFVEMDILDPKLESLIQQENIEVVNHHAAQISVTQSVADPSFDANINILGSLKLMKCAADNNVKRFIFASTGGAIYGEQDYFPADENHPCRPLAPYGIAKFSVENYLGFFAREFGLKSTILRYANVYGPRQDPHGEAGVVAIFCKKLIGKETPIIFGDGEQTRDFVCVFDVVQANVLVLKNEYEGVFNVGTGKETSVNELSRLLIDYSREGLTPLHHPPRKGEQQRSSIDPGKIQNTTGWKSKFPLNEGLAQTFEFFRKKQNVKAS
jgi:UDP-glucose 4-epimerase